MAFDKDFILQAFKDIASVARKTTSGNVAHNRAEIIFIADYAARLIGGMGMDNIG